MKKNFVILSSGAYSEYTPIYFMGETLITQEQFTAKSLEIGDRMWEDFEALPERTGTDIYGKPRSEKFDPERPDKFFGHRPDEDEYINLMSEWLTSIGYEKVPEGLPEINIYYDVPRSSDE